MMATIAECMYAREVERTDVKDAIEKSDACRQTSLPFYTPSLGLGSVTELDTLVAELLGQLDPFSRIAAIKAWLEIE